MIGSIGGCEQFAINSKQYFENEGEIPDKILREYLNTYLQNKNEKNEEMVESITDKRKITD